MLTAEQIAAARVTARRDQLDAAFDAEWAEAWLEFLETMPHEMAHNISEREFRFLKLGYRAAFADRTMTGDSPVAREMRRLAGENHEPKENP